MTTIILVDDHPIIRHGLRMLLEAQPDIKVVGETGNGFEALQMIGHLQPDVALLDLMIEGMSGIEVAKQLNQSPCRTAIIVFSVLASEHYVLEALRAGAKGYLLKESPIEEMIHALQEVTAGRRYFSSPLQGQPYIQQLIGGNTPDLFNRLTAREREILECSLQGNTCAEIATQLHISRRTVETHRANMMRKLGLTNGSAPYRYAFNQKLMFNRDAIYKMANKT